MSIGLYNLKIHERIRRHVVGPLPWAESHNKHDFVRGERESLFSGNIEVARCVVERCASSLNELRVIGSQSKLTIQQLYLFLGLHEQQSRDRDEFCTRKASIYQRFIYKSVPSEEISKLSGEMLLNIYLNVLEFGRSHTKRPVVNGTRKRDRINIIVIESGKDRDSEPDSEPESQNDGTIELSQSSFAVFKDLLG